MLQRYNTFCEFVFAIVLKAFAIVPILKKISLPRRKYFRMPVEFVFFSHPGTKDPESYFTRASLHLRAFAVEDRGLLFWNRRDGKTLRIIHFSYHCSIIVISISLLKVINYFRFHKRTISRCFCSTIRKRYF